LEGQTFAELVQPGRRLVSTSEIYDRLYGMAQDAESMRVAGSVFGSMQHVAGSGQHVAGSVQHVAGSVQHVAGSVQHVAGSMQHVAGSMQHVAGSVQHVAGSVQHVAGSVQFAAGAMPHMAGSIQHLAGSVQHVAGSVQHITGSGHMLGGMVGAESISSYIFPSGVGMWAMPTMSGLTASGVGMGLAGMTTSGMGMNMSGVGMVGSSASAPPERPRKFWLVADAELIVYGATEPDATVTIGGRPVKLNSDGTFRFQMHFPDGNIDFPVLAVAADGEQNRAIHMTFDRATLERRTNTKEEAVEEWL
jgi:uncharacterized protein